MQSNAAAHTPKTLVIDNEDFNLAEFLKSYGYLLDPRRDPNCWLWLKGTIADDYLPHARDRIYAAFGMVYTPPLTVTKHREQCKQHILKRAA
jgi:hypothetical protein